MHPASRRFNAILQANSGTRVGLQSFKQSKRCSPMEKFQYRRHQKIDTVTAHKKFFNQCPHLIEFAKHGVPAGTVSEMIAAQAAQREKQLEDQRRLQLLNKKKSA